MKSLTRSIKQHGLHADVTYDIELERRKKHSATVDFNECRVAVLEMLGDF